MENAKKMLLIEPSLVEKLNQYNRSDNPSSRLDTEMSDILNSKMDDRKKCILYLQILQRYLHFNEENRRPIEIPMVSQNVDFTETNIKDETQTHDDPVPAQTLKKEEKQEIEKTIQSNHLYTKNQILSSIPKTYLRKGENILDLLSNSNDKINWNDSGTVIIDNEKIPGSNIIDLINDLLRPLKNNDPIGWESFAKVLKDIKIPLIYLGNPKRIDYIKNLTLNDISEVSTDEEFHTPTKKYVKKIRNKLDWEKWNPY